MKKTINILIFFIFLISLPAAALEFPFLGKVNCDDINLRSGPSIYYESIDKLKKETSVKVVSEELGWYKIALPKTSICFISRKYVKKLNKKEGVVLADSVNLRAKPTLDATILGQVNKDYVVNIVHDFPEWYGISAPVELVFGWTHKKFIDYYSEVHPLTITMKTDTQPAVLTPPAIPAEEEKKDSARLAEKEMEIASKISVSGIIKPMGIFFRRKGTHKLIKEGKIAYYLNGEKKLLNSLIGYKVNISGEVVHNQKIPIIKVEKIEIAE